MRERVRIVLADDHALVRQGLRLLLEREPRYCVVGEAADGPGALELCERLKPDILIADLVMPGLGGLDVTREVVRRFAGTRVVVLTMQSDEVFVLRALRNGASGFVLKESTVDHLGHAIEEALAGRRYLSPPLSERAVEAYLSRTAGADAYDALTRREREVLHLAAEGLGNPEIGRRLGISPRTAETHRAHVMEKLGLRTKPELIAWAVKRGLFPGPPAVPTTPPAED